MKLAPILALALLAGCAGIPVSQKAMLLEPGDSQNAVVSALGVPQNRQFRGKLEAWQYCSGEDFAIVWFEDDIVTATQTYNDWYVWSCRERFRTIDWRDAPDIRVEVSGAP